MTGRWRLLALILAGAAVLGAAGFTAYQVLAEDDPYAGYCAQVRRQQQPLSAALAGEPRTALIDALPNLQALADAAPDDVREDWRTVVDAVRGLREALDAAGVDPSTYDPANPAPGLDARERQAITAAAIRLDSTATRAAWTRVQQQVRDVCHTPLTL